ncbi:MAG TPA: hypothetical protein VML75_17585 [Kofleriaceae bacterium]|nr:hypothetical protein [Kofleriaceae bacterium]
MQIRRIILAAAVVGVLGLVALVVLGLRDPDAGADVPADRIAEARAEYERRTKLAGGEVGAPTPSPPAVKRTPREPVRPEQPEDRVFEKQPREEPAKRARPERVALGMRQPAISMSAAGSDPELKKRMDEVSAAYDSGDYPTAHQLAIEVLGDSPRNIKMLRVVVSTSCSQGEGDLARKYAELLPERDRKAMATRCTRWGVDL